MIKHWSIANDVGTVVYLCNQAVLANMKKTVLHLNQITCKNCKKILKIDVDWCCYIEE